MNDIAHKAIVLKLNKFWRPVGVGLVSKTLCDLMTGVISALDIVYKINPDGTPNLDEHEYVNPVDWDEWITLPVRPWDLSIRSAHLHIRIPTVVITKKFAKMPEKRNGGKKPTKEGLALRDNLTDCYTGEELDMQEATIDHIIPRSHGGPDTYENTGLTTKKTNNLKGNKTVEEAGLTLFVNPHNPKPIKVSHTIRKARHPDWEHFLVFGKHK